MRKFGIGQAPPRREDVRFLTGRGCYVADIPVENCLIGHVVRAPFANAALGAIDAGAARAIDGVRAVLTAGDVGEAAIKPIPCFASVKNRDGSPLHKPDYPVLATDRVRFVGQPVAFIVAETREAALDAEDALDIDYDPDPAAAASVAAAAQGPAVWPHAPDNLAFDWQAGTRDEAAFESAAHIAHVRVVNNRVAPVSMEPRAALAFYDDKSGYTLHVGSQGVAGMHAMLSAMGFPSDRLTVKTPDVGGGFGMKGFLFPEYALVLLAANKTGRPVRWVASRADSFLSDTHGRDLITDAWLAMDADGRFLAYRVETDANMGAYFSNYGPLIATLAPLQVLGGPYAFKAVHAQVRGRFTHTAPVDAYRGAGRPEAAYVLERAVDAAADLIGLDAAELRRRNFPRSFPYTTAMGTVYDSGDFVGTLDQALQHADYQGFDRRRAAAKEKGRLRGIGLAYYTECTLAGPSDDVQVAVTPQGRLRVAVGTQSTGQSHETTFAQVLGDRLGIDPEQIDIVQGDTAVKATGIGTGGSHSLFMVGGALVTAAEALIDRGKALVGELYGASRDDIAYEDGLFRLADSNVRKTLFELQGEAEKAKLSEPLKDGLALTASYNRDAITYPNGCHVAEVEVDPQTGVTKVVRYSVADDFGVVVNPQIVAGQVHGGVAQGLGQALMEQVHYDADGQLLSASFMDYGIPHAEHVPPIDFSYREIPCTTNPLGVKGCGEAGTIGALPAVTLAVLNALKPRGVTALDMPLTPERVWRALTEAA